MDEVQDDITNYWAVGSASTGARDHTKFFVENKIWEDASGKTGNPVNKPVLDMIKKGDYLLVQSTSTKGTGTTRSVTKLKAVGKVVGRVKDNYYTFLVAWDTKDPSLFPKDFNGISYGKTIESMKVDEMLRYARKVIGISNVPSQVT